MAGDGHRSVRALVMGLEQQMEMVGHQAERMACPAVQRDDSTKTPEKISAVPVISKERATVVPSRVNMVETRRHLALLPAHSTKVGKRRASGLAP
jgi:hypothetical protein